ncbi:hypothetical protein [Streptomyces sp. NPDC057854]|uniref:hypothetical protein n=1 Tax=unclassified Streptomyces TaxID=2593676 RepID=UPI0036CFBC77
MGGILLAGGSAGIRTRSARPAARTGGGPTRTEDRAGRVDRRAAVPFAALRLG